MNINPQLLVGLLPILQRALQTSRSPATNVTNALQNGYDTGIMNELFQKLYNARTIDGEDRYAGIDALNALNAEYGPRESIPTESAESAANVFQDMFKADDAALNVAKDANISNKDWLENSSNDDMLDMLWKRNNREPLYTGSGKFIYSKD